MAAVGFIVWLVRLEGRISVNLANLTRLETDMVDCRTELEDHRANAEIHFSQRLAAEVDKGNERRFITIETQLSEINRKLDNLAGRS
jgi:hypothetical protein